MSTVQLVGFRLIANPRGIYPCYLQRCNQCLKGLPPLSTYTVQLSDLTVLDRTPDEIKRLPQIEIERLRSLLAKMTTSKGTIDPKSECLCPKPEIVTGPIPMERKIRIDNTCCYKKTLMTTMREESWSCPFCRNIICDAACLFTHIKMMHVDLKWLGRSIIVDRALLGGGLWCPLCSHVFHLGKVQTGFLDWRENITAEQLFTLIEAARQILSEEIILEQYTIQNKLCQQCSEWDEKKLLRMPISLKALQSKENTTWMKRMDLYPLDTYVPPNVMQYPVYLSDLGAIQTYDDEHSQLYVDLLRQDHFEEIKDSFLEANFSDTTIFNYMCTIWDTILYSYVGSLRRSRTFEEVKATPIPGEKVLAKIRTELVLLDNALTQTKIIAPLCQIIQEYLPWQLRNLERLLSRVHADVIRYAPSLASLISVIGPKKLPWVHSRVEDEVAMS
ncbi:MAG: hypothetical protein Harvfovirus60_9 [Harvfovirus sp.]|uniref:C2H2-type domain-containing protein n=1 Tax=Harvfovirus sp. TaxID=2487768 RepID=A0A3G5A3H5_9VIRU|nr:MAG: hypothetical protein Harvfovirus60_9 [Harvfovirus sp.]